MSSAVQERVGAGLKAPPAISFILSFKDMLDALADDLADVLERPVLLECLAEPWFACRAPIRNPPLDLLNVMAEGINAVEVGKILDVLGSGIIAYQRDAVASPTANNLFRPGNGYVAAPASRAAKQHEQGLRRTRLRCDLLPLFQPAAELMRMEVFSFRQIDYDMILSHVRMIAGLTGDVKSVLNERQTAVLDLLFELNAKLAKSLVPQVEMPIAVHLGKLLDAGDEQIAERLL